MKKVIVLGGCGAVGRIAVKTLAASGMFSQVAIGDIDMNQARRLSDEAGRELVPVVDVDATDYHSVASAIKGYDLVVNCVGPFYLTVVNIARAVIDAGTDYVDVCDDVDVTVQLLDMSAEAEKAGITMVIGMGNSPGATNLLAKFAAQNILDKTESVDIFHAHGGEPFEGRGVIGHRFHCMSIDIPMYLDGKLQYVKFFEEDGMALRRRFDFPLLGNSIEVFPYPHPEQVTLPRYLDVNRVTNRGTILPAEYYRLTMELCRLGLADKTPVDVGGVKVTPYDFAVSYLIRERERILKDTGFKGQKGCTSTVVAGTKDGRRMEVRFHMASESKALGEGTGIPVAMAAILMSQGKITAKGIYPPEGCIDPGDFISLIPKILSRPGEGESDGDSLIVEFVNENGEKQSMDMIEAAGMFASL